MSLLDEAELRTAAGETRKLGELMGERALVVILLRHPG